METALKESQNLRMRILSANFKLFYQNRGLWYWYFLALFWFFFLFLPRNRIGILPAFSFASILCGGISASLQKEIITKPFAFLLPDHRMTPRRVLFITGVPVIAALAFFFTRFYQPSASGLFMIFMILAFWGMTMFLLSAWLVLAMRNTSYWGMFIFLLMIPLVVIYIYYGKALENIIFHSSLLIVTIGLAISVKVWRWLGKDSLARELCGKPFIGPGYSWNIAKLLKYQRRIAAKRRAPARPPGLFESYLFRKVLAQPPSSRRLMVFGNFYGTIGGMSALWGIPRFLPMGLALFFFAYFVGFSYVSEKTSDLFFFSLLLVLPGISNLVPLHNLSLSQGRKEKANAVLLTGIIIAGLSIFLSAAVALISNAVFPLMPEIVWKGATYRYHPVDMSWLYLSPVLPPIALMIAIQFRRAKFYFFMCAIIILPQMLPQRLQNVPALLGLTVLCWLCYFAFVKYYFQKKDLVFTR